VLLYSGLDLPALEAAPGGRRERRPRHPAKDGFDRRAAVASGAVIGLLGGLSA